jgi:hypothetical protein
MLTHRKASQCITLLETMVAEASATYSVRTYVRTNGYVHLILHDSVQNLAGQVSHTCDQLISEITSAKTAMLGSVRWRVLPSPAVLTQPS